jgi:hypothetical protein
VVQAVHHSTTSPGWITRTERTPVLRQEEDALSPHKPTVSPAEAQRKAEAALHGQEKARKATIKKAGHGTIVATAARRSWTYHVVTAAGGGRGGGPRGSGGGGGRRGGAEGGEAGVAREAQYEHQPQALPEVGRERAWEVWGAPAAQLQMDRSCLGAS